MFFFSIEFTIRYGAFGVMLVGKPYNIYYSRNTLDEVTNIGHYSYRFISEKKKYSFFSFCVLLSNLGKSNSSNNKNYSHIHSNIRYDKSICI